LLVFVGSFCHCFLDSFGIGPEETEEEPDLDYLPTAEEEELPDAGHTPPPCYFIPIATHMHSAKLITRYLLFLLAPTLSLHYPIHLMSCYYYYYYYTHTHTQIYIYIYATRCEMCVHS
jgi:hypothetical protein